MYFLFTVILYPVNDEFNLSGRLLILFELYTGKGVKFLVLLVRDFPQRPVLSLSHASTHTPKPNPSNITMGQP